MKNDNPNGQKHDNIAMYFVYAAAAYFGFTFLMKGSNKSNAATINPYKVAEPPPVSTVSNYTQPTQPIVVPVITKSTTVNKSVATKWVPEFFPLAKGMKGTSVKALQLKLGVKADGIFGANTEAALFKKFGIKSLTADKYQSIVKPAPTVMTNIVNALTAKPNTIITPDTSKILTSGSKGADVYKLQKWLGFKDKAAAKKGEPIADSIFGKQTLSALQKKTGQTFISVDQLNTLMAQGNGFVSWITGGKLGMGLTDELLITKQSTTIYDNNLIPVSAVPANTILGKMQMSMKPPQQPKTFIRFLTMDGKRRWVEQDAV